MSSKHILVVSYHKNSHANDVTNYKPVSFLSNFSKLFEKVAYHRLSHFINKHIPNKSTTVLFEEKGLETVNSNLLNS